MKILLLGSTILTERVGMRLSVFHEIVGHVPSIKPTVPGKMRWPAVPETTEADLTLSVQYDRKWKRITNAYNLHTGTPLTRWAGCDILWHTLMEGADEQGLTFHAMTDRFDTGRVIGSATYPVLHDDTVADLYGRMLVVGPKLAEACVEMIDRGLRVEHCPWVEAGIPYKRGDIHPSEKDAYLRAGEELRRRFA